jgi:hypothetical protein
MQHVNARQLIVILIRNWLIHSFTHQCLYSPFVGSWPLLQFRNIFTQSVGLLGRVISPSQGRYLHTDIHALSGIRTHDPSVRASENSSCLRPSDQCDRPKLVNDIDNLHCLYTFSLNAEGFVCVTGSLFKQSTVTGVATEASFMGKTTGFTPTCEICGCILLSASATSQGLDYVRKRDADLHLSL